MSLRYVCGIIKDSLGRYLTLEYTPAPGVGNIQPSHKCTVSIESWVEDSEDTLDVLVSEISDILSIPMSGVLSSLDLRLTRSLRRTGAYCDQTMTAYVFLMDGVFKTKCFGGVKQHLMTVDQIQHAIVAKRFYPTTYCKFVMDRMHLWEAV